MNDRLGFLNGGGVATRLIGDRDWTNHPLGPPERWSEALKTALSLVLNSPESMILAWGPELTFFFNETYFPLLGPRLSWAMGERFDKVWADGWEQAKPIIDEAFAGRSARFDDLPWRLDTDRGAAETFWSFSYSRILDDAGDVAGLFIFTNETTDRVLAQRELHALNASLERQVIERTEALRLFANIVHSDTAPICAFDTDYRLVAFNQAHSDEFFRIYAYRVQIGDVFPDLFVSDQRDTIRGFMDRALSGESFTVTEEFGDPTVAVPHWEVTYNPLRTEDGRIVGAFHHALDVTDRLRAQAELATAQEALRQAQKMEAVGQLTGGLAHDFNNLLTAVTGGLELLQHRVAQGRLDDLDRYIGMAKTGADRAAALTQRLLAFSRRQTLAPTSIDVDRLVAGMQDIISRSIGPSVEVVVVDTAGLWPILADAPQLESALLNLCINARDAMPEGGTITIQTGNQLLDARAAVANDLPEGEYVSLCVTDTGMGMTPDVIERVFDPFFTTKPIGSGTGLGLSMIYGFVRQSGGQVRISSEVGAGTTMCLYLPRHVGAAETPASVDVTAGERRRAADQTVLLVEDEPAIRDLVGEVLDEAGFRVLFASNGPAGVKLLRSDGRIDLLITDVGLPGGLNGRQVADAGRAVRPGLKVLFITGYAANAAVGAGHMDEGMEVLTKPFNVIDLERRVHDLLNIGR